MRWAAKAIALALLVLGAISLVAPVLYALLALSVVLGAIFHPREMLALAGLVILSTLAANHGLALLGLLALLAVIKLIRERSG